MVRNPRNKTDKIRQIIGDGEIGDQLREYLLSLAYSIKQMSKQQCSKSKVFSAAILIYETWSLSFSFSFSSRWHRSVRKGPYALRLVSQQSPQGCPRNSTNICLVEHRSFSTLEGGMSAASFLHSSFLQAVSAMMLCLVRVEKVPHASEHLCPAKLQIRSDICCACQSI